VLGPATINERFAGRQLDEAIWTPAYLPSWSSTREAAATHEVIAEGLRLTIPAEQPLWCADLHEEPLCVSAIQSGNWSGPVGSTRGQQPFADGLVVREAQRPRWGFTPCYGRVEVECRATLTERSMFSAWMVGLEIQPDDCGEICLRPGEVDFLLDGERLRTVRQAPTYPMQLIVGVFDFPRRAAPGAEEVPVPELVVRRVSGLAP
jgi:hypothetical protein